MLWYQVRDAQEGLDEEDTAEQNAERIDAVMTELKWDPRIDEVVRSTAWQELLNLKLRIYKGTIDLEHARQLLGKVLLDVNDSLLPTTTAVAIPRPLPEIVTERRHPIATKSRRRRPPRAARALIHWGIPAHERKAVLRDREFIYREHLESKGPVKAAALFWVGVADEILHYRMEDLKRPAPVMIGLIITAVADHAIAALGRAIWHFICVLRHGLGF